MSFADFITNKGIKICKDHYIHLVQTSRIDGKITSQEMDMLHKKGKFFGLTDPEIDMIINSEKDHHYTPRYSLKGKFEDLFSVAQIVMADGHISEPEKKVIKRMSIESGFEDSKLDGIVEILLNGVKENIDEDELFKKFKKYILD